MTTIKFKSGTYVITEHVTIITHPDGHTSFAFVPIDEDETQACLARDVESISDIVAFKDTDKSKVNVEPILRSEF